MATQHGRDGPPARKRGRRRNVSPASTPDPTPSASESATSYISQSAEIQQIGSLAPGLRQSEPCAGCGPSNDSGCRSMKPQELSPGGPAVHVESCRGSGCSDQDDGVLSPSCTCGPSPGTPAAKFPAGSSSALDDSVFDGPLVYDSGWEQHERFEVRVAFFEGPSNLDLRTFLTKLLLSSPGAADVFRRR